VFGQPKPTNTPWHLLRVAPGRERTIARQLERRGVMLYLPLVDRCVVVRTAKGKQARVMQWAMFSGYILVYALAVSWPDVLETPGVRGLVREGGAPFVVPDRFVRALWWSELEWPDPAASPGCRPGAR
jgi:transcription antitermination factor NusG